MTVVPFPPKRGPSPKAVKDFKRACDDTGLDLRKDDEREIFERIEAMLLGKTAAPELTLEQIEQNERDWIAGGTEDI